MAWRKYKSDLRAGSVGKARIEKFTISREQAEFSKLRSRIQGGADEIPQGNYTRLKEGSTLWMSDTPFEVNSVVPPIMRAKRKVLITGLGLGVCTAAIMAKEKVECVHVVEKSKDIIDLVTPQLKKREGGEKLTVYRADAYKWKPRRKGIIYDYCFHDIWPTISGDNWEKIMKLKETYNPFTTTQIAWQEQVVRRLWERAL